MRGEEDRSFEVLGVEDPVAVAESVFSSRYGPRMQRALVLVLEGAGYREAARRAGLGDHKDVFRAAKKLELRELHEERRSARNVARYSKRDLSAVEAVLAGNASTSQVVRAFVASRKRVGA